MYRCSAGPISTSIVNSESTRLYLNEALLYKTVDYSFPVVFKAKIKLFKCSVIRWGILVISFCYSGKGMPDKTAFSSLGHTFNKMVLKL